MDESAVLLSMADRMLWIAALVAAPILLASLAIGLVIGLIQAATSVNEQTLTFVPKIVATLVVFGLGFPNMMNALANFMRQLLLDGISP